ncbi:MAG TPA: adenylyl-sulfate kinase, partial [Nitrospirae bacterium]|nr:adenylyl-sulfate kinase [Nitrospirota bacterium]
MIHSLFDDAPEQSDETSEQGADEKKGFFRRLVTGLSKTRKNLNEGFDRLIGSHTKLDEEFMEELEELLFSADVGVDITMRIVSDLRADVKKNLLKNTSEVIGFIKKELIEILNRDIETEKPASTDNKPFVILVIGVNGSGKTTTVGKLAAKLTAKGHSVLLAAGDTFRAAAIDQLEE